MVKRVKIVLGESRKPEKLWVDRCSEFYNKTLNLYLKNMKQNYILLLVI